MRFLPAAFCCILALFVAASSVRVGGDGGEYVLSARALAAHGTPAIREADAMWLSEREPTLRKLCARIAGGIQLGELTPFSSVRRAPSGAYYSLHFWGYSLLAVPFLRATEHFGLRPALALASVNGLAACGTLAFLFRRWGLGAIGCAAAMLFLLAGTTFYLGWTGPEVLTGGAVLVACLLARRGELGLGCIAAGVAAAQNPSAVFLFGYVAWLWWQVGKPLTLRDRRGIGAGLFFAAVPYAFFFYEFRVPSLIAHFATDFSLITFERAFSLLFDLNEGVIVGVPGVLLGSVSVAAFTLHASPAAERRKVLTQVAAAVLLVACMATPTLSIHNWNSGGVVFIRYAYWLVMPLFELALELGARLASGPRAAAAAIATACQLGIWAANGYAGQRYSYLRHSWAAEFVLTRWPGAYNPVPEIFFERTLGWEASAKRHPVVGWPREGPVKKILVRADRKPASSRVCPDGQVIAGARERAASRGWKYIDAPFRCEMR